VRVTCGKDGCDCPQNSKELLGSEKFGLKTFFKISPRCKSACGRIRSGPRLKKQRQAGDALLLGGCRQISQPLPGPKLRQEGRQDVAREVGNGLPL